MSTKHFTTVTFCAQVETCCVAVSTNSTRRYRRRNLRYWEIQALNLSSQRLRNRVEVIVCRLPCILAASYVPSCPSGFGWIRCLRCCATQLIHFRVAAEARIPASPRATMIAPISHDEAAGLGSPAEEHLGVSPTCRVCAGEALRRFSSCACHRARGPKKEPTLARLNPGQSVVRSVRSHTFVNAVMLT